MFLRVFLNYGGHFVLVLAFCVFFGVYILRISSSLCFCRVCYRHQCRRLPGKFRLRNDLLCVQ